MGKGAFLIVTNKTENGKLLKVGHAGADCMNNQGNWDELIPYDKSAERQYIEAKSSWGCASQSSIAGYAFFLLDNNTGKFGQIGNIVLLERMNQWSVKSSDINITIKIDDGDQDTIYIDVSKPN